MVRDRKIPQRTWDLNYKRQNLSSFAEKMKRSFWDMGNIALRCKYLQNVASWAEESLALQLLKHGGKTAWVISSEEIGSP